MLSNNRLDLNDKDVPVQTINFGQSSFIIDNKFNESEVSILEKKVNNNLSILRKDINLINDSINEIKTNNKQIVSSSVNNLNKKIFELDSNLREQKRINLEIKKSLYETSSKIEDNQIDDLKDKVKVLEIQLEKQIEINNSLQDKINNVENKADKNSESVELKNSITNTKRDISKLNDLLENEMNKNIFLENKLNLLDSNISSIDKKVVEDFTEKITKLENKLTEQIEATKLNSTVSNMIIDNIENTFKTINKKNSTNNDITELVKSHIELDLMVKKNTNQIDNLKNNQDKNIIKKPNGSVAEDINKSVESKFSEINKRFENKEKILDDKIKEINLLLKFVEDEKSKIESIRLEFEKQEVKKQNQEAKKQRLEAERLEAERIKKEAERLEAERIKKEAERLEAERLEAERLEAERLEAERKKKEAERLEAERLEAERLKAERLEAERLEAERLEAERLEAERLEAERVEAERLEAERLEAERLEAERLEAERLEAEKLEAERLEAERLEAERLKAERLEAERIKQEAERKKQEAERIKQEEENKKNKLAELIKQKQVIYPNAGYTFAFHIENNIELKKKYTLGVFIDDELRGKTNNFNDDNGKIFSSINVNLKNDGEKIEYVGLFDGTNISLVKDPNVKELKIGKDNLDKYPTLPIMKFNM